MSDNMFNLVSKYTPTGDQPDVIESLVKGVKEGKKHQVLLGLLELVRLLRLQM